MRWCLVAFSLLSAFSAAQGRLIVLDMAQGGKSLSDEKGYYLVQSEGDSSKTSRASSLLEHLLFRSPITWLNNQLNALETSYEPTADVETPRHSGCQRFHGDRSSNRQQMLRGMGDLIAQDQQEQQQPAHRGTAQSEEAARVEDAAGSDTDVADAIIRAVVEEDGQDDDDYYVLEYYEVDEDDLYDDEDEEYGVPWRMATPEDKVWAISSRKSPEDEARNAFYTASALLRGSSTAASTSTSTSASNGGSAGADEDAALNRAFKQLSDLLSDDNNEDGVTTSDSAQQQQQQQQQPVTFGSGMTLRQHETLLAAQQQLEVLRDIGLMTPEQQQREWELAQQAVLRSAEQQNAERQRAAELFAADMADTVAAARAAQALMGNVLNQVFGIVTPGMERQEPRPVYIVDSDQGQYDYAGADAGMDSSVGPLGGSIRWLDDVLRSIFDPLAAAVPSPSSVHQAQLEQYERQRDMWAAQQAFLTAQRSEAVVVVDSVESDEGVLGEFDWDVVTLSLLLAATAVVLATLAHNWLQLRSAMRDAAAPGHLRSPLYDSDDYSDSDDDGSDDFRSSDGCKGGVRGISGSKGEDLEEAMVPVMFEHNGKLVRGYMVVPANEAPGAPQHKGIKCTKGSIPSPMAPAPRSEKEGYEAPSAAAHQSERGAIMVPERAQAMSEQQEGGVVIAAHHVQPSDVHGANGVLPQPRL